MAKIEVNPPNEFSLACSPAWQNWSKLRPGEGVISEEAESKNEVASVSSPQELKKTPDICPVL